VNYAPHTLFVQRKTETRDEYNRVESVSEEWERVGVCRCDDNTDRIVSTENSLEYVPKYHIVTNRTTMIHNGDRVRVIDANGLSRGEGKADRVRVLNYLNYTDFYAG
jgi:hypothetical protein